MTTDNKIIAFLHEMEEKHNIRVLYAVNSGSLSFGYASPESDTDVRFIYISRPEYYFSITPKADTVHFMSEDHALDMEGFDLKKALGLMTKTNPKHAMYHFHSISVKHHDRCLKEEATLKRFIYYMRGLLACKWIEGYRCHPPVNMDELIDAVVEETDVREAAHRLLATKRLGRSHNNDPVDTRLVAYMNNLRYYYEKFLPEFKIAKPVGDEHALVEFLMENVSRIWRN